MSRQPEKEDPAVSDLRPSQLGSVIDAYIDWREECVALEYAYLRWAHADAPSAEVAYAAYRACLDQEERASALYAELLCAASPASPAASPTGSPLS